VNMEYKSFMSTKNQGILRMKMLKAYAKRADLTFDDLLEEVGISFATLDKFLRRGENVRFRTLAKISSWIERTEKKVMAKS